VHDDAYARVQVRFRRTFNGIVDLGDLLKVQRIGDAQDTHALRMTGLLEVLFEGSTAPVGGVTANLTLVFDTEHAKGECY